MRAASGKAGPLSGQNQRVYQDMMDQEMSRTMAKGGGIGLADMMYQQLKKSQEKS